jgi:hypothetical protein
MKETGPKSRISLSNLCYYFDGVERERMDAGAISRKSGEWLQVRSRLMQLPDSSFEVVMRSINSLIDSVLPASDGSTEPITKRAERDRALALFEKVVQAERSGASTKGALEKASPI